MNYINFDLETYSPSNLNHIDTGEFRISVAGCYVSWIDQYIAFMETEINDFVNLLSMADLVIGYNILGFDLPVLQKYCTYNALELPVYDLLAEIEKILGFRLKLDDLCKATFDNDTKTDTYAVYKNYHKEGKWFELIDYCMNDVRLTEQLFRRVLDTQNLHYYDLHKKMNFQLPQPDLSKLSKVTVIETLL
jgi:DEAD/DEAH box helicase domain-containing protein